MRNYNYLEHLARSQNYVGRMYYKSGEKLPAIYKMKKNSLANEHFKAAVAIIKKIPEDMRTPHNWSSLKSYEDNHGSCESFSPNDEYLDSIDKIGIINIIDAELVKLSLYVKNSFNELDTDTLPLFKNYATRYLSYVDKKTEQEIIRNSPIIPFVLDEETNLRKLQQTKNKAQPPEESKSFEILPPRLLESTRAIYRLMHKPELNYHQAYTWIMNPSLRYLMVQGWDRSGNDVHGNPSRAMLPTNPWLIILTFLGNFSKKEARVFHDKMRFFARKKVLLADINTHFSHTILGKASSSIKGLFYTDPYPYQDRAKLLQRSIAGSNNEGDLLRILKKEAEFITKKPPTIAEKKPVGKYAAAVKKHFKRLSLP